MIKKNYYKLSDSDFQNYLTNLKNNPSTLHFFQNTDTPYFLVIDQDTGELIINLHKKQLELDYLYHSLSPFQQKLIIQTCMINEIQSTNSTENIYSTRSDIFGITNNIKSIKNKKIISIIHSYNLLNQLSMNNIENLSQIKELYESLMEYAYDSSQDHIDGLYFRKNPVYITNGIKTVHNGFNPEGKIIEGMKEYLEVFNNQKLDLYLRLMITHFMLETIHPYYDGNGRFGRLLMSLKLYQEESTLFSYCIATSMNQSKTNYYKALESARDLHEFGCLNDYIHILGKILLEGMESMISDIQKKVNSYQEIESSLPEMNLTKSEKIIYDCLVQATLFTYFGISNEQIIQETKISKRTLISSMNKFKAMNLIIDYKPGKTAYHRIRIENKPDHSFNINKAQL